MDSKGNNWTFIWGTYVKWVTAHKTHAHRLSGQHKMFGKCGLLLFGVEPLRFLEQVTSIKIVGHSECGCPSSKKKKIGVIILIGGVGWCLKAKTREKVNDS